MIKTEQDLRNYLASIASRSCWNMDDEDFCVVDYSGSNVDDAFYGGMTVGEVNLARALLKDFFDETIADEG